jgi:hypothetical protein
MPAGKGLHSAFAGANRCTMADPFFFGYGSLVNRATHDFADAHPAQLHGWRRAWRHTKLRPLAFLTGVPAPGHVIDGLVAHVPGDDWQALDVREHAYDRCVVTEATTHPVPRPVQVQVYAIADGRHGVPDVQHPVLLSYIDVVVQGYLCEFGPAGVTRFFATTDGWDAPILNDRAAPVYPRHQQLSGTERALVDEHLEAVGANLILAA